LHSLYSLLNSFIKQALVDLWDLQKVNRWLVKLGISIADSVSQVLIHVLGNEWSDTSHESSGVEKDIKQDVETSQLLIVAFFSLHSWSVKSNVPVG